MIDGYIIQRWTAIDEDIEDMIDSELKQTALWADWADDSFTGLYIHPYLFMPYLFMELAEVWPQGLSIASHHPKTTLQSLIYQHQFADSVGGESQKLKGWT